MARFSNGEDSASRTVVLGESFAFSQTTVPGPAARPRPNMSQRADPCRTRPVTIPVTDRARRASRAWSPESTVPTAGPAPATAMTLVPGPCWAVTSQAWPGAVVTERAAWANGAPRPWAEWASVPSNRSDAWVPENALPSTAAASPVRSRRISRSWPRMTSLVMSEETTPTPARTRKVTAETARSGRPDLGRAAWPSAADPGMVPPEAHYYPYVNEYSMLYRKGGSGHGGHRPGASRYVWSAPICKYCARTHGGARVLIAPGRGGTGSRRHCPAALAEPGRRAESPDAEAGYVVTVCGKATGLRLKFWSTARTPNWTLSLAMLSVTEVTLPTGIAEVQSLSVVSRITTSYPVTLVSGLAFQVSGVRLVPAKLTGGDTWICTFLGVLGEEARFHSAVALTLATRAM